MKTIKQSIQINRIQLLLLISIALTNTSCVSYKPVSTTIADKPSSPIPAIAPGDVLRITLKSGEKIEKIKVKEIDSEKISGTLWVETTGTWIHVDKTIMLAKINEIKRRKFSAGKTAGLVVFSIGMPLLIIAATYHPMMSFNLGGHP